MFYISNENIEEALKVISGFHVEKIDLVKFTTFNMVLAQKEFRERIYQHYCEAVDDRGYLGSIKEFIRECMNIIIYGLNIIKGLSIKAKEGEKKRLQEMEQQAEQNLETLRQELYKIRATESIHQQEQTPPKEKYKIKELLIVLNELGALKSMKEYTKGNINEVARILSVILQVKPSTLQSYLNPILQTLPDYKHKNSPYCNPENKNNAMRLLNKI